MLIVIIYFLVIYNFMNMIEENKKIDREQNKIIKTCVLMMKDNYMSINETYNLLE